jgi:UDP-galactopyranose mutase
MIMNSNQVLIVGAGFYGAVLAEQIANKLDIPVTIIDKRDHIGGNSYSCDDDETGLHYHKYGTHIFHTPHQHVWDYINKFTEFNSYFHQVLTTYKNKVYQMPINLETINSFYNLNLKPYEVDTFLKQEREKEPYPNPQNFEEKAITLIGKPLYEAFIKGYTQKQWQTDPKNLPAAIINRLPVRSNYNESYYFSRWQGIPLHGYGAIFDKMLDHPKITVQLNTDYFDIKDQISDDTLVIYTGPIDELFGYKYGRLEWRGLDFKFDVKDVEDYQGTSVMNYAESSVPYTRVHEPKHLHPEITFDHKKTLIIEEYSKFASENDEPYYPINNAKNQAVFDKYHEEAKQLKNIILGGRLGAYKYYDMHDTINMALDAFNHLPLRSK